MKAVAMTMILVLCMLVSIISAHGGLKYEEVPDFEFDDSFPTDTKNQVNRQSPPTFDFSDFDDFFIDDGSEPELDFVSKEKMLKNAILRALSTKELKYKFSEVMPLLRRLSKAQRMVFSSIISAQINGGRSFTFDEVKEMFGSDNSKPLLLPIIYDLANLIREGFLRSDKFKENEKQNRHQFLRRSFNTNPNPTSKNSSSIKEVDFSSPVNYLRDDTMQVEIGEPIVRNIEHVDSIKAEPLIQVLNKNLMTINSSLQSARPAQNMSMEEIENLALKDLNGTLVTQEEGIRDVNGSEISPMALISRNRKRPPYQINRKPGPLPETCERFTGGICLHVKNYPTDDIMGSIRRHRYAMDALLAEYRDKHAELEQIDYLGDPTSDLTELRRRKDEGTSNPGAMCSSIIRYARPQKARSATGEWKFIVNTGEHTQTLRLEKCSQPLEPCSYLTENFESQCTQVYNYHRLLSWDNTRGLHVDIFKVPTCCSCHLVGYKEAFPPLASPSNSLTSGKRNKFRDYDSASSNRNSQYSTISLNDDDDENSEEEDDFNANIAYQFGNGFKRINPKKSTINEESNKNRIPVRKNPSLLPDSYLTPPANDQNSNFPFNRFSSRQRTPALRRKHNIDQSIAESDLKISHVTVFPPKQYPIPTDKPRKLTPPISTTVDLKSVNIRLPNASQKSDVTRVNYNYHPIIDFFEDEEGPKRIGIDRKTGKVVTEEAWRPIG